LVLVVPPEYRTLPGIGLYTSVRPPRRPLFGAMSEKVNSSIFAL